MQRTLLLLAFGPLLTLSALAQTHEGGAGGPPKPQQATTTSGTNSGQPPRWEHMGGGMGILTPEERQELMAARQEAMQANPDLADQMKALQQKINAAMIKADPKVAPIIAKVEAARQNHEGGGPPPNGKSPGN